MDFKTKLKSSVKTNNSLLCVGLDPEEAKIPDHITGEDRIFKFTKAIVDSTADLVCAFKPNSAFFEGSGADGINQLHEICEYIRTTYPSIPIILDFKRADIGNTNNAYAEYAFEYLKVDAITVNPYLGSETLEPFLQYKDKGIIVLCRTSNPGASEIQDLDVNGKKLYEVIAEKVKTNWNSNNNCLLVVGATYPEELAKVRMIVGDDMSILVPGIGAQGGDADAMVKAGVNKHGTGIIVNSSRGIIFASNGKDFDMVARDSAIKIRDQINNSRPKI
jgi:orotidine-5'-phosphate decarboxylase